MSNNMHCDWLLSRRACLLQLHYGMADVFLEYILLFLTSLILSGLNYK